VSDRLPAQGFAWIELLAVIAVTLVLAALAASAYRTHEVRLQVTRAIADATRYEQAVEHAFRHTGQVPAGLPDLLVPRDDTAAPGDLESVGVIDGRLDLYFGRGADRAIAGGRLSLTPHETASQTVVWICGNRLPAPGLRPLGFAGGGRQATQVLTTIEPRYLPSSCR